MALIYYMIQYNLLSKIWIEEDMSEKYNHTELTMGDNQLHVLVVIYH